jgi:hypothetical protein
VVTGAGREDSVSFAPPSVGRGVAEPGMDGARMSEKGGRPGVSEVAQGLNVGENGLPSFLFFFSSLYSVCYIQRWLAMGQTGDAMVACGYVRLDSMYMSKYVRQGEWEHAEREKPGVFRLGVSNSRCHYTVACLNVS